MEVLIAARVLQGVGAAFVTPGSLAIIESTFRREDRARAIGAWSALGGIAAAVGPLLGGFLVDAASWRAIFLLNVPVGLFVVLVESRHVPESRDETVTGRLDYAGSVLAVLALGGSTYALIEAPVQGLGSAVVLGALVAGMIAAVAFLLHERRTANPMLPLSIFSSRQFASANLVTLVVYAALGGVFFLLVVFLQTSLGYSPVAAGAAALPVTVLMLLLSVRFGALAQRIGPRLPLTVGPLLLGAGMLLMTTIEPGDSYVAGVLPPVAVFGLGLAGTVAPVTATALAAADERHSGVASGVNNAVSRFAGLLAVAALPVVAGLSGGDFEDPAAFADGFRAAMFVASGLAVLGAALAFLTIRNDVLEAEPAATEERAPAPQRRHASHCAVGGAPLRVHQDAA